MGYELALTAVNHIQFEVIDSTKMSSTTGSKHGKKMIVKKPDTHTSRIQHESFLQKHLSVYGFQPMPEYHIWQLRKVLSSLQNSFPL